MGLLLLTLMHVFLPCSMVAGMGTQGQLGNGVLGSGDQEYWSRTPVVVTGGHLFSAVCTGFEHSCALEPLGQAWCWGERGRTRACAGLGPRIHGNCSLPSIDRRYVADLLCLPRTLVAGDGLRGQLGTGTTETSSAVPVQVTGGHTFRSITCGRFHSCALDEEGHAWCWGEAAGQQLLRR